jgi:hypothetical protein
MEDVMEDISVRKPVSGRRGVFILSVCIVTSIVVGATWMSLANTSNHGSGTAFVQIQPQVIDDSLARNSAPRNADNDSSAAHAGQDDEVDIALGGSWRSSDCTFVTVQVVKVPSGEMVEALDCQRTSPKPVHAYESYANEALESLAYSDPIAALVLGRRLAATKPEETWNLMIRSSALLGGDPRPIRWLATNSFNQVRRNGEMAKETIQLRYVLDSLSRKLENTPGQSFDFREHYLRSSLSDTDFDRMDHMVNALLNQMKAIEEETTGRNTIREGV